LERFVIDDVEMQFEVPPGVAHEHRLAVVMNGGVSLAVWMGGVAYELDTLRRASNGIEAPATASPQEKAVYGLWGSACGKANVTVTVDVIAGTSAGGLNGVLSAASIARGAPLSMLRELWKTAAELSPECLLSPQGGGPASILNGDFFHTRIQDALSSMPGVPSDGRDISLTVTATGLAGPQRQIRDSAGQLFSEPDSRRRYVFNRQSETITYSGPAGRFQSSPHLDDFQSSTELSLAARASASFPGAFAPVPETADLRRFRNWPDFDTGADLEWLADGGILDNSPFEPVLQAIADQNVTKPWRRTLCYVVPSGNEANLGDDIGSFAPSESRSGPLPLPWTSVVAAGIGLPREADFRDNVEQIHALIRSGRSEYDVTRFLKFLAPGGEPELDEAVSLATAAMPLYRQARAAAGIGHRARQPSMAAERPAGRATQGVGLGSGRNRPDIAHNAQGPAGHRRGRRQPQ
jgi:patatin-related protein